MRQEVEIVIAHVAPDIDVLGLRREDERVERQVGLDETPVALRLQSAEHLVEREQAHVEPRGIVERGEARGRIHDELADDLLHPSRPRFAPSHDDDVVVPELESVPTRRIENRRLVLAFVTRPGDFTRHR